MRDFQRSKVYRSEKILDNFCEKKFETVKEVEGFINEKILPFMKENYDIKKIVVGDGRGRRRACAMFDRMTIKLPKWARKDWVIAHEIAHLPFTGTDGHSAHGEDFCALYLKLIEMIMGGEVRHSLENSFDENGVRY